MTPDEVKFILQAYRAGTEDDKDPRFQEALAHVEKDAELAGSLLNRGCRLGDGHSCSRGGRMYRRGRALEANPKRAIALFSRACALDRGKDCLDLGLTVEGPVSKARAFNRACHLGVPEGCARLGLAPRLDGQARRHGAVHAPAAHAVRPGRAVAGQVGGQAHLAPRPHPRARRRRTRRHCRLAAFARRRAPAAGPVL